MHGPMFASNLGPKVASNDTKLSRYLLDGGEYLVRLAIDCMRGSKAEDPFLLGKAEELCVSIAHESGADVDWVRNFVCAEAF